jgi:pimeloyl-ACP methyl ester carboxylesterase
MVMAIGAQQRARAGAAETQFPPIWKEATWPAEWLSLHASPTYYGLGVPRGDGSPVVVIPGFMSGDAVMYEMYAWLGRIGYRAYLSGIALNASCPGATAQKLVKVVERAYDETGERVKIVGHSLGGLLGRRVTLQRPDLVSQLVYLGSPIRAMHAHPLVTATAAVAVGLRALMRSGDRCLTSACGCGLVKDMRRSLPPGVEHAAIYTRGDGVVDWHDARERDPRRNFEVGGTHVGLVYNPRAYRVLGELLAN